MSDTREQVLRALFAAALNMGGHLHDVSAAERERLATSLASVAMIGDGGSTKCHAAVHVNKVEACCQGSRQWHDCDKGEGHSGPHQCGWCDLRHDVEVRGTAELRSGPYPPGDIRNNTCPSVHVTHGQCALSRLVPHNEHRTMTGSRTWERWLTSDAFQASP